MLNLIGNIFLACAIFQEYKAFNCTGGCNNHPGNVIFTQNAQNFNDTNNHNNLNHLFVPYNHGSESTHHQHLPFLNNNQQQPNGLNASKPKTLAETNNEKLIKHFEDIVKASYLEENKNNNEVKKMTSILNTINEGKANEECTVMFKKFFQKMLKESKIEKKYNYLNEFLIFLNDAENSYLEEKEKKSSERKNSIFQYSQPCTSGNCVEHAADKKLIIKPFFTLPTKTEIFTEHISREIITEYLPRRKDTILFAGVPGGLHAALLNSIANESKKTIEEIIKINPRIEHITYKIVRIALEELGVGDSLFSFLTHVTFQTQFFSNFYVVKKVGENPKSQKFVDLGLLNFAKFKRNEALIKKNKALLQMQSVLVRNKILNDEYIRQSVIGYKNKILKPISDEASVEKTFMALIPQYVENQYIKNEIETRMKLYNGIRSYFL